ncbi:MAG: hypothetical protein KKH61_20455, partial [Gammaproteobacteria bacterium]|nr:hypothetical protein [Gammaproteobacteria bacterium]
MKIFADLHHDDLYTSLQMLLEDRLGHELYRPLGLEWFTEGYWKIAEPYGDNMETVNQYLRIGKADKVYTDLGFRDLNEHATPHEHYKLMEGTERPHKAVTLEQFIEGEFDVMIASYINHVRPYYKLIKRHNLKCKLIHQMGNSWTVDFNVVKNLMASVKTFPVPVKSVFYHQEFDTKIFEYKKPLGQKIITSFVSTLRVDNIYKQDWHDFEVLERELSSYRFKAHGAGSRDKGVSGLENIADRM